jgi:hypothetical protein
MVSMVIAIGYHLILPEEENLADSLNQTQVGEFANE